MMENNIEELIRKDFRKREIVPSDNAFQRLNTKLDAQKTKSKRKNLIRLLGYAAGIIGIVFTTQFVLQQYGMRTVPEEISTTIDSKDTTVVPIIDNVIVVEQSREVQGNNVLKEPIVTTKVEKGVVTSSHKDATQEYDEHKITEVKSSIAQSNHKNVVLYTDTISVKQVTEAELDALLAEANLTLTQEGSDSIIVNSNFMLYEIEVEINKPLPEKVFLTLKTGATTLKELVKTNTKN